MSLDDTAVAQQHAAATELQHQMAVFCCKPAVDKAFEARLHAACAGTDVTPQQQAAFVREAATIALARHQAPTAAPQHRTATPVHQQAATEVPAAEHQDTTSILGAGQQQTASQPIRPPQ